MTEQISGSPKEPTIVIDPKMTRVNLGILGTVLVFAVGAAFKWTELEVTVGSVDSTLKEVKQTLKEQTDTLTRQIVGANKRDLLIDALQRELASWRSEVSNDLQDIKNRLRVLENAK